MRPGHASPPLQPRRGQRPHRYPRGLAGTPRLPLPAPKASPQAPRMQCSRPASSNAGGCAMLHVALVAMRSAVVRRWFGFGSVSRRQPGSGGFLAVAEDGFASKVFCFVCLFVCLLARSNTALQQGDITSVPGGKAAFWDSSKQSTYSPAPVHPQCGLSHLLRVGTGPPRRMLCTPSKDTCHAVRTDA